LITEDEGVVETGHEKIMVLRSEVGDRRSEVGKGQKSGKDRIKREGSRDELTLKRMMKHIKRLVNFAEAGDGDKIREELKQIVPEYEPQDNRKP